MEGSALRDSINLQDKASGQLIKRLNLMQETQDADISLNWEEKESEFFFGAEKRDDRNSFYKKTMSQNNVNHFISKTFRFALMAFSIC